MEAGKRYLQALRAFGLEPEGLFWVWDKADETFVLWLVSRYFDIVGPARLSSLLFRAYNASATPAEIDPFIVHLHSPDHHVIRTVIEAMDDFKKQVVDKRRAHLQHEKVTLESQTWQLPFRQIYLLRDVRQPKVDLLRKWGFIERKVEALAA